MLKSLRQWSSRRAFRDCRLKRVKLSAYSDSFLSFFLSFFFFLQFHPRELFQVSWAILLVGKQRQHPAKLLEFNASPYLLTLLRLTLLGSWSYDGCCDDQSTIVVTRGYRKFTLSTCQWVPSWLANRPFPSSLQPLFQSEAKCEDYYRTEVLQNGIYLFYKKRRWKK